MVRGFLPFVLALIGFPVILISSVRPIFEWQISEISSDVPSSYDVRSSPSPWKTGIGDSLVEKSYVFRMIHVSENGNGCSRRDLNIAIQRSRSDELWEQLSLALLFDHNDIRWLIMWTWIEIAISIAYMFWFAFWHAHRTFSYAVISAGFATLFFCYILIPMLHFMGPRVDFSGIANCHGTIMFRAQIIKVYYSVPILFLAGIFAELAALIMMVRQIVKRASSKKESSRLAVG
jgi:hypothetical protein